MVYPYFHGNLTNYSLTKESFNSNKASVYMLKCNPSLVDLFNQSASSDPYSIPAVFYTSTVSDYSYNFSSYYNNFSSSSFSESFFKTSKDIHPIALRYETLEYFFYERKPFLCTSTYKPATAYSSGKHEPYTFWVPWTLYVVSKKHNQITAYMSHKQLTSKDDTYVPIIFPNTYPNGSICMGSSADYISSSEDSTRREYFDSLINNYWSGSWNSDLPNHFTQILRAKYNSLPFGLDKKLRKNYPLISSFIYFEDSLTNKISEIHPRKIVSFAKKYAHINYSNSYYSTSNTRIDHKRLLIFLSTLSLNETLRFYEEASRFLKNFSYHNGYSENYIDRFSSFNSSKIFDPPAFDRHSFGSEISNIFASLNYARSYNYPDMFTNSFSIFFNSSLPHPLTESTMNSSHHNNITLYNNLFYSLFTSNLSEYESLRSVIYPIIFSMNSSAHNIISQSEDGSFYLSHKIPFEDFSFFSERFKPSSDFYDSSYSNKFDYSHLIDKFDQLEGIQLTSFLYESLETPYFYTTDPFISKYALSISQHS